MRLLFLDIDGVLNCEEFFISNEHQLLEEKESWPINTLDPKRVELLNAFIEEMDLQIVLSSTWRLNNTIEQMNKILKAKGLQRNLLDKTPRIYMYGENIETPRHLWERGMEIDYWLKNHAPCDITSYVIFDDSGDLNPHLDKLVKTSWEQGLKPEHLIKAKNILLEQEKGK